MLVTVILVSVALHLLAGVILGGIVVFQHLLPDEANFEEPPAVEREKPRPNEVKVDLRQQAPSLGPSLTNLRMKQVGDIGVDDVDVSLPSMSDSFTVSAGISVAGGRSLKLGSGVGLKISRFPDIKGFGSTKKVAYAWEGTVYLFGEQGITRLLNERKRAVSRFRGGQRQNTKIYNYELNIPVQDFSEGFPGVTKQFEWFAIDFGISLHWPASLAGDYQFRLNSDDGSVLFINRDLVVDNDGEHHMQTAEGGYTLTEGKHRFRLVYFQGAAKQLGLILEYRKAGEQAWKIFDLREYIQYQVN